VLRNIETLNQVKTKLGAVFPRLGIEFVAQKQNVAELPDWLQLAGRLGANRAIVTHPTWTATCATPATSPRPTRAAGAGVLPAPTACGRRTLSVVREEMGLSGGLQTDHTEQ